MRNRRAATVISGAVAGLLSFALATLPCLLHRPTDDGRSSELSLLLQSADVEDLTGAAAVELTGQQQLHGKRQHPVRSHLGPAIVDRTTSRRAATSWRWRQRRRWYASWTMLHGPQQRELIPPYKRLGDVHRHFAASRAGSGCV